MGSITDGFASAFRDYVSDGVPASGPNEPAKSEVRAIGPLIEAAIGTAALGSVDVTKDTRAHLDADLAHDADSVALVYADATDANNDLYIKVGASGSGSWTLTTILHDIVAALFAAPLTEAEDAATAADASATAAEASAASAAASVATALSPPNGTMAVWLAQVTTAGSTASATVQSALAIVAQQLRQTGLLPKIVRLSLRCGNGVAAARIPFVQRLGVGYAADTGTISAWTEANGLTGATVDTGVTLGAAGLNGYNLGLYEYCLTDNGGADTSYTMGFGTTWGLAPRFVHDTASGVARFVTFSGSSVVLGDIRRLIGGVGTYPILGSMMAIRQPNGLGSIHRNGIMLTGSAPASSQNAPDNTVPTQSVQVNTTNVASGGDAITEGITPAEAAMLHHIVHGFNVAIGRGVTAEGL